MGIKVHKGPFNMRCISNKNPKYLISDIQKAIDNTKIHYKPVIFIKIINISI